MISTKHLVAIALLFPALMGGCNLGEPLKTAGGGGGTEVEGLYGSIVTEGGSPAVGALVRAYSVADPASALARRAIATDHVAADTAVATDTTDDAGTFVLADLPAGVYNIAVTYESDDAAYALFRRDIAVSGPAVLPPDTVRPSGTFSLRIVTGETPLPGALCAVPASPWASFSDSSGLCLLTGLPPGILSIDVTYPGARPASTGEHAVSPNDTVDGGNLYLEDVPDTLGTAQIVFPYQGTQTAPPVAALNWTHVPGSAWYHIQIATDSSFSPLAFESDSAVTDSFVDVTLTPGSIYFWRVRARNALTSGAWSTTDFFVMPSTGAAFTPKLVSPPASTTLPSPDSVRLVWEGVYGATAYHLQIAGDTLIASAPVDTLTDTTFDAGPRATGLYGWRVRAVVDDTARAWSETRFFLLPDTAIGVADAPTLVFPANGDTTASLTPELRWTRVASATSYRVQITTDSGFSVGVWTPDSMITDTMRVIPWSLDSGTTHYWRVRAQYESIADGAWSAPGRFTTPGSPPPPAESLPPPPAAPVAPLLLSPGHAATGVSLTPTLAWDDTASTPADSYILLLGTDSLFAMPVVRDTLNTKTATVGPLSPATMYFWRVVAVDSAIVTDSSGTTDSYLRVFTTAP